MKKFPKITNRKIIGIIPVRMAASRFPGKPLKKILGTEMLTHVYARAKLYNNWTSLNVAVCDKEIKNFCKKKNYPFIDTSKKHKRCLDRIYEAATKIKNVKLTDIVVCVQGDEPMLRPDMFKKAISPLINHKRDCSVLAMDIIDEKQYQDPNIVKIVNDVNGRVLYTSRSPIPYSKKFTKSINAKRIYGIFAFTLSFLKKFYKTKESPLEIIESCDSNRICDNYSNQYIARYKNIPSFSVDCKADLKKVEKALRKDPIFKIYEKNC